MTSPPRPAEVPPASAALPRAVLVTGAHRSGTTVLGELLCQAPRTAELWEPFNPDWGLRAVRGPYPYLPAGSGPAPELAALARHLETGRGRWRAKPRSRNLPGWAHDALRTGRRRWDWHRSLRAASTVVVKDPFLLLALGGFGAQVCPGPAVVSCRHPCAWVQSLVRVGWPAGRQAGALLGQAAVRSVVSDVVSPRHLRVSDWSAQDPLEAGAVVWACLYRMVEHQRAAGASVHVVPLEDFSTRPEAVLAGLYERTGLVAPADLPGLARTYTTAATVQPGGAVIHELRRDSRRLALAWREQLDPADAGRIRAITGSVYDRYYADWLDPTLPV